MTRRRSLYPVEYEELARESLQSLQYLSSSSSSPPPSHEWVRHCRERINTIDSFFIYPMSESLENSVYCRPSFKREYVDYLKIFPWLIPRVQQSTDIKETLNPKIKSEDPQLIDLSIKSFWLHGPYSPQELEYLTNIFEDAKNETSLSFIVIIHDLFMLYKRAPDLFVSPPLPRWEDDSRSIQIEEGSLNFSWELQVVSKI